MIVVMTSWAPLRALSTPAIQAQKAPKSIAKTTEASRCSPEGIAIAKPM